MARPEKVRLGEILVQQNLLTPEQLKLALDEQKRSGRKLGRVFIEQGYVTEEEISEALAKQLQVPYINLKYYNIKPEVVQKLPETQARRFRAIVLDHFDMSLGLGLGKLAGKAFRIGHLGDINDLTLCGALCGVEMGFALAGVPHKDRKSTRLNSSHIPLSRMPSSA